MHIIPDTRHNWTIMSVYFSVCCCTQALLSQGSDVVYSYGHHTTSVRLPQSMTVLREVQCIYNVHVHVLATVYIYMYIYIAWKYMCIAHNRKKRKVHVK